MTRMQRFALWIAARVGVLPRIDPDLVDAAVKRVKHAQLYLRQEAGEYRRHMAMKQLIQEGVTPRQAALAIEVAVSISKGKPS